jgi:tRNA nucleotidyltransferase/poly(A) polymerase
MENQSISNRVSQVERENMLETIQDQNEIIKEKDEVIAELQRQL